MRKILLPLLILLIIEIIIFKNWFLADKIIAGDFWYYFPSMYGNHFSHPYSWYTTVIANGLGGQGFAYQDINIVAATPLFLARNFHSTWELTTKIFFFIPYIIFSFIFSAFLFRRKISNNIFWIVAPLIFSLNTYVLMTAGGGQIITALSYSLMPLTLYLFINLPDKGKKFQRVVILSALSLSAQILLDLRIAFVTALTVLLFFILNAFFSKPKEALRSFILLFFSFILVAIINSYWLIPILRYGIDPIQQLGIDYSSSAIVKFFSFARLENSISLLHPYWPDNIFGKVSFMKPEFLLLPVLAFASLLFLKNKEKRTKIFIVFFALLAIIGTFLGKGATDPFGNFYIFLFKHVPGFQLFRDSFKWYTMIALSYSMLIPFTLSELSSWLKLKLKIKYLEYIVLFSFFVYFLFLLMPFFTGVIGGTFKNASVPVEYSELNSFLSQNKGFFRTMWIPSTMQFSYYTPANPSISGKDFFREYDFDKLLKKLSDPNSRKILEESSVKYVIVPQDSQKEIYLTDRKYDERKYQKIVKVLDRIPWLRKEAGFGKMEVYSTNSHKDHFWCDCDAEVTYKFINPTRYEVSVKNASEGDVLVFSESYDPKWSVNGVESKKFDKRFNSFTLPGGKSKIIVSYSPQSLVDKGVYLSLFTLIVVSIILLGHLVFEAKNVKIRR